MYALTPHILGMLMTGYVTEADVPDGVALLKKPFTTQELIYAVQAALGVVAK